MSNTIKILSSEAKVHTIGYAYASTAQGHNTSPLTFRLLPGMNEVNAEAWAKAKKLRVVQHYIEIGAFREVVTKAPGLRGLNVDEAIDMVNQTLDRALLATWKNTETRDAVLSAIDQQVDKVTYRPERDAAGNAKDGDDFDMQPRQAQAGLDGAEIAEQVQTQAPPPQLEVEDAPVAPKTTPPQRPAQGSAKKSVKK